MKNKKIVKGIYIVLLQRPLKFNKYKLKFSNATMRILFYYMFIKCQD